MGFGATALQKTVKPKTSAKQTEASPKKAKKAASPKKAKKAASPKKAKTTHSGDPWRAMEAFLRETQEMGNLQPRLGSYEPAQPLTHDDVNAIFSALNMGVLLPQPTLPDGLQIPWDLAQNLIARAAPSFENVMTDGKGPFAKERQWLWDVVIHPGIQADKEAAGAKRKSPPGSKFMIALRHGLKEGGQLENYLDHFATVDDKKMIEAVKKVGRQVHPDFNLAKDVPRMVATIATAMADTLRERSVDPNDLLNKHARNEQAKARERWDNLDNKDLNRPWSDVSRFAGLQFPVAKDGSNVEQAAATEYLAAEMLELAGNIARDYRKITIQAKHLARAIAFDEELSKLFFDVIRANTQ